MDKLNSVSGLFFLVVISAFFPLPHPLVSMAYLRTPVTPLSGRGVFVGVAVCLRVVCGVGIAQCLFNLCSGASRTRRARNLKKIGNLYIREILVIT